MRRARPPVSQPARNRAEREAINSPIQGTAADIIKLAMLALPGALAENELSAKMLLQVHDELVFEVESDELPQSVRVIQRVMRDAYPLDVPLKTDAKAGPNWYEMETVSD